MSIVPFFYQHFHDLSGKLAAAGRMHVYVAGSPIAKPIWSDVSMSIARDNPMPLDGNGVAPQWFVGEGLVDIKVYTSTGSLIFTALNVSGTAASGQTPWPAASTGYLYFDEVSGVYSWRDAPGDHKVMVNTNDTPAYLDQKLLGNGDLQWQEVEIEPGVWGMRAVINTAGLPGIETLTLLPPSHMEFRQLSVDPKNPRFLLEWTGSANDLVKTDGNSIAKNSLEPALGNPTDDGMVLASTATGQRYWRVSGGAGVGYLPLAGGEMAPSAAIQWPDGGSGTIAFNDDDGSWTILQRTQLFFAPSASRSGAFLQTSEYGGSQLGLMAKAGLGTQDVLIYGKIGGGGYAVFNRTNGDLAVALGAGNGDNGEIRVENASGAETFNHSSEFDSTHLSGVLVAAKKILQWASELVTSSRYVKITDTTIGPSATAKASLLNGGVLAGGFAAVTDPAARWNALGAASETVLKGSVSSAANQVIVFELYRNGAVSATLALPARNYGAATPWRLVIDQVVRVAGSTGTVRVKMRAYVTADNVNSAASCYDMSATLTGVDLTASHTWDVVCSIPNNASNSITCDYAKKIG